mmetsp:Transcript_20576/g.49098  ORF Transcript_20576/g.49098 Transcript_20576/m.49098 type:complete len:204 (-) Transcript_20576:425-1036(-)
MLLQRHPRRAVKIHPPDGVGKLILGRHADQRRVPEIVPVLLQEVSLDQVEPHLKLSEVKEEPPKGSVFHRLSVARRRERAGAGQVHGCPEVAEHEILFERDRAVRVQVALNEHAVLVEQIVPHEVRVGPGLQIPVQLLLAQPLVLIDIVLEERRPELDAIQVVGHHRCDRGSRGVLQGPNAVATALEIFLDPVNTRDKLWLVC